MSDDRLYIGNSLNLIPFDVILICLLETCTLFQASASDYLPEIEFQ